MAKIKNILTNFQKNYIDKFSKKNLWTNFQKKYIDKFSKKYIDKFSKKYIDKFSKKIYGQISQKNIWTKKAGSSLAGWLASWLLIG